MPISCSSRIVLAAEPNPSPFFGSPFPPPQYDLLLIALRPFTPHFRRCSRNSTFLRTVIRGVSCWPGLSFGPSLRWMSPETNPFPPHSSSSCQPLSPSAHRQLPILVSSRLVSSRLIGGMVVVSLPIGSYLSMLMGSAWRGRVKV